MTIFEYTALKNPEGAKRVVNSFGEKAIRNPQALARQLADKVNKHGEKALYRIASVHPDFKLVSDYVKVNQKDSEEKEEKSSCSCQKENYSNADGNDEVKKAIEDVKRKQELDSVASNSSKEKSDKTELMIIGAVALIGLALVTRN